MKWRSLEHLGVVRLAWDEGYILVFRNLLDIKIFEVELREIAPWKGGYEKPSKYRTVILIIDHFCRCELVKGIYLMFWVSMVGKQLVSLQSSWQTVGQCLAMMTKSLGHLQQCWQTVGRSLAMLANSWAVLRVMNKNSIISLMSRKKRR